MDGAVIVKGYFLVGVVGDYEQVAASGCIGGFDKAVAPRRISGLAMSQAVRTGLSTTMFQCNREFVLMHGYLSLYISLAHIGVLNLGTNTAITVQKLGQP